MALLKFLRRPDSSADVPAAASSAAAEAVAAARQRARRRLLGAVVLLGVGIIGFPLVFQTQPRPIPVDIPIDIPRKDAVAPLAVAEEGGAPVGRVPVPAKGPAMSASDGKALPSPGPSSGGDAPSASAGSVASSQVAVTSPPSAPVEVEVLPPSTGKVETAKVDAGKADTAKADAPKAAASKPAASKAEPATGADKDRGRFVVQAGSFTDLDAVRETRAKLERMGLKTYTQAAVIDGVTRVRVRVGPYASRQEAQDVQNKIKAAGLAASLLQL